MKEMPDQWWGDYRFKVGEGAQWEIGPLRIGIQRFAREWLVAYQENDEKETQQDWRITYSDQDLNESKLSHIARFAYASTIEEITVQPALADRPVISRPLTPFTVPAAEKTAIYISTPLWFTLITGSPAQTLIEVPTQRPSDTWFGPSTQDGEVCYAIRTYSRLNLENVPVYAHRAITQVNIHNNSSVPLLIERLNLPVPYLSLFHTNENSIWTEAVTVVLTQEDSMAEFHIEKEPPPAATDAKLIASARQDPQKGMLIRTFGALRIPGFD